MGDYSSGDEASLPADTTNLDHVYDATDLTNVQTNDTNYVDQTGSSGYEIHQYKDSITATSASVTWIGKSSLAPSSSKVQLQVYKVAAPAGWQDVSGAGASNNVVAADTDFTLSGTIATADYLDTGVTTFRIYQAASAESSWVFNTNLDDISDHFPTKGATFQTCTALTGHVPGGTTGVILLVHYISATAGSFQARPTGEAVDWPRAVTNATYYEVYVKLDGSLQFDYSCTENSAGDLKVYIRAYTNGATWLSASVDKSQDWTGQWTDVDVSGQSIPGNSLVLCTAVSTNTWFQWGMRTNGSSFAIVDYTQQQGNWGVVGPADSSSIFEYYGSSLNMDLYVYGWIPNVTAVDPPTELTFTTTGGQTFTLSSAPAGTVGVLLLLHNPTAGTVTCEARKYGSTDALGLAYATLGMSQIMVGVSADKKIDINVSDTNAKAYVMGYIR